MTLVLETNANPALAHPECKPGTRGTPLSPDLANSRTGELPHVLFLIDRFPGPDSGGAEAMLVNIIRRLPRDKFRRSLVTFGINPKVKPAELFPCPVYIFPLRRTYDWNGLKTAIKLAKLIRQEKISIVHTFFETSDLWGGMIAKLSGCPLLVSSRRDMGILRKGMKHDIAYRFMRRHMDLVLPVSNQVREFCIERDGLDPRKVVTLYNGVEVERLAQANGCDTLRTRYGLNGASHIISTVANIRPVKGIDVLIRAAAIVCRQFPHANFVIVGHHGEGGYFKDLQDLCESLGICENIKFVGGQDEIGPFLNMSQVFCLPSRSEGFSNALIEAMACSLPCVATRVGGNSEALQDGSNGYLVENEDAEAMANRILALLQNPGGAKEMGAAARRVVEERFTMDAMMANLVRQYDSLLSGKRS